jgi:hypothetical protein
VAIAAAAAMIRIIVGHRSNNVPVPVVTAGNFCFSPKCLADLASIAGDNSAMKTITIIFVLALITIAFEVYSDAALTSTEVSHAAVPDPATKAVANALKRG